MDNATSTPVAQHSKKPLVKVAIVVLLIAAVGATLYLKDADETAVAVTAASEQTPASEAAPGALTAVPDPAPVKAIPRLVDLGADKCIPCKMMAPMLAELREEYADRMSVEFIDVWKNPNAGQEYGVRVIPTQIFYDAAGNELFRHEGFYGKEAILSKWRELGVDLTGATEPEFSRWEPAEPDTRPKETVCYLCDGSIVPETRTIMATPAGDVAFCTPHCYLITYASLTEPGKSHEKASVSDASTGTLVPVLDALYLQGVDTAGHTVTKAFAAETAAKQEQQQSGGNLLTWAAFESREMAVRCGFCDRPVYLEDASIVRVNGLQTYGCCTMCALGVAARTGEDIVVEARDALTGEPVKVVTMSGHVAELTPATMVGWAGARKDAEGKVVSTGCFKQAFFANEDNLKRWVEAHPTATGRLVTIEQALQDKMKLSPEQISKACKIGECTPK